MSNGLSFSAGDILTVMRNDDDTWWYAKNANGEEGYIKRADVTELEPDNGTYFVLQGSI